MAEHLHTGHRQRLRESSYKNNFKNLEEHQLLELLLTYIIPRRDTNPIAHRLINNFGSFKGVLDAKLEDLVKVEGVGNKTANFLVSLKHFFYAYNHGKIQDKTKITTSNDAAEYAKRHFAGKNVEECYVICLENNCKVKHCELISSGSSNKTDVNIRKVLEVGFKASCSNIIFMHNHPEGDPNPSISDNKLTKALVTVLAYNNMCLVDHIIVSQKQYYSYKNSGLLERYRMEFEKSLEFPIPKVKPCAYGESNKKDA